MKTLKIAMLQMMPAGSLSENLKKGIEYCNKAKSEGADIALFPEMWSCGYEIPQNIDDLNVLSISKDSEFINSFSSLAKELDIGIGITFLESYVPSPRNSFILFDRHGQPVLHYAKVHTCDFGDERVLTAGDDFYVCDLDTNAGKVKIGTMICYDREFPESARILMLKGAEIILVPNACPMEINRISQLRGRAYENMVGIITCNYPKGNPDCNGHSTAFDGIAYKPELEGSRDTLLIDAGEEEGVYIAEFDLDELRAYREDEVHGNAYRKPGKYKLLPDEDVKAPFVRDDAKR